MDTNNELMQYKQRRQCYCKDWICKSVNGRITTRYGNDMIMGVRGELEESTCPLRENFKTLYDGHETVEYNFVSKI
jgi:hypothetical protein